jgi:DNA primase|tara:strand:- start:3521 stop:4384 length:864 start_codon:yes stop_codon:yes gene_type:complete
MIDWTQALLNLGIDVPVGTDEISILCPFHDDTSESCSINLDKGVWICFAGCGQGGLKSFLQQYKDWDFRQVNQYLSDYKDLQSKKLFVQPIVEEQGPLPEVNIPFKLGMVPKWIFDRGFDKQSMKKWLCGISPANGLIIPVKDNNFRTVGWITRQEKQIPKYLYSKGLKKSHILFGQPYIRDSEYVCVTEGPLDAMWLNQLGFPAVALLGMSMSDKQRDLLLTLPTKELILCLDNDEAGQRGKKRAFDLLGNKIKVSYINIPEGYKDVQDIKSYGILKNVIKNKKYW